LPSCHAIYDSQCSESYITWPSDVNLPRLWRRHADGRCAWHMRYGSNFIGSISCRFIVDLLYIFVHARDVKTVSKQVLYSSRRHSRLKSGTDYGMMSSYLSSNPFSLPPSLRRASTSLLILSLPSSHLLLSRLFSFLSFSFPSYHFHSLVLFPIPYPSLFAGTGGMEIYL